MKNTAVMLTKDRQVDRRILLQADSLQAAGWQVTIIAMPQDAGAREHDPRVVRLHPQQAPSAQRERLVLNLYRAVGRHVVADGPVMRALRAFAWRYVVNQETLFLKLFEPAIAQHPADVYVAHDLPLLPVALHGRRLHGAKVVYDSHELFTEQEFSASEKRMWRAIEERAIRQCDAVMTVNASVAHELTTRYGLAHVHVVYNAERPRPSGLRTRRFHERLGLEADDLVLLMQGGLTVGRNLEQLVAAFTQVRNPQVHLVVLGDGMLTGVLQQRVRADGTGARVHLLPAVPQDELLAWTEAADAGVIPYLATCLNNYYSTPNKLFEFIAAGVPILGSDLPEIRRIIEGNGIGRVADLGDEARIAAAIDAFFADFQALASWKSAVLATRETVNWQTEGRKVVKVFEGLR
ncbi:MAG: glycosyltransferase [Ramlibacter sp.]|nr:glycosyltransferase [Ramlibacter sp.]